MLCSSCDDGSADCNACVDNVLQIRAVPESVWVPVIHWVALEFDDKLVENLLGSDRRYEKQERDFDVPECKPSLKIPWASAAHESDQGAILLRETRQTGNPNHSPSSNCCMITPSSVSALVPKARSRLDIIRRSHPSCRTGCFATRIFERKLGDIDAECSPHNDTAGVQRMETKKRAPCCSTIFHGLPVYKCSCPRRLLGRPVKKRKKEDKERMTSGWPVEKIEQWIEEQGECKEAIWPDTLP